MLGTNNSSTLITISAAVDHHNSGGGSSGGSGSGEAGTIPGGGGSGSGFSDEDKARIDVGGGGGGGNRWPRQETVDLLRIRSEMEDAFRDSNFKGPLWEEVSRKMSQLGYSRNARKCKEKFENVYKYHKRTKDGRASKSDGKTYRWFGQLEALDKNPNPSLSPIPIGTAVVTAGATIPTPVVTVSSAPVPAVAVNPVSFSPPALSFSPQGWPSHPNASLSYLSEDDQFTSSSASSGEEIRRRSRKRKLQDYFEGMLRNLMEKQQEMHKNFLETLEKYDRDRMTREEAWRVQEMARMKRELDLLNQERAMAATRDAAIVAFLQTYAGQDNLKTPPTPSNNYAPHIQTSLPLPSQNTPPTPVVPPPQALAQRVSARDAYALVLSTRNDNGGEPSSARWPKGEVEALIKLRANMDLKYQDGCPKGSLWEEISSQMSSLGYNRSSKRCKEKWENINKYFRKVKESNKKRPEDSKTCPYFDLLDALYKEKGKTSDLMQISYPNPIKPETPVPIMARPEQQWPIQMHKSSSAMEEDHGSEHFDENDDVVEDDDERETKEGGGGHETVTNQQQASMSMAPTTG